MSGEPEFIACLFELGAPPRVLMPNPNSVEQDAQVLSHMAYVHRVDVWYLKSILKFGTDEVGQAYGYVEWSTRGGNPYCYQLRQAEQWRNKFFEWLAR
jgi:hypothetical protein